MHAPQEQSSSNRTGLTASLRTNSNAPVPVPSTRSPFAMIGRALFRLVYVPYALLSLFLLIVIAALLALLLPSLEARRVSTRWLARAWLAVAFLRLRIDGLEHLPAGSCVLVANHASYLDGVVMKAALPPRFSFVIKREASSMPVLGLLLRRIGSEFVDRHSAGGRQRDARRVMARAGQGHSLVFFPEGTFDSVVGVKRFHIGAFVAAARGGMPLVPSVIHGARKSMPNGTIAPHPGVIRVEILPAIDSSDREPDELRDVARGLIIERVGEPDLAELAHATPRAR
jgi:1-acyl-sn-glycerol-3-phosphate acyltransferase